MNLLFVLSGYLQVGWFASNWLAYYLIGWLSHDRQAGWLASWPAEWLAYMQTGWLAGWLEDQLAGSFTVDEPTGNKIA